MDKIDLFKYIEGDCSDEEKILITTWIDSSPENMKEYAAFRKLYDISLWQSMPYNEKGSSGNKTLKHIYIEIIKIAAILLIGFFLTTLFFNNDAKNLPMQTIIVPAGQRVNLQLADGTMVWLNARTRLTFPTKFSSKNREVTIDGEGYFEVAHDKTRPFIVKTGKYNVKVWGTRFNIKAYTKSDEFETSIIDGSVEIIKPDKEQGIFLKPNDKVFLNKDQLIVKRITNPDQFLWKEGIISFENEPFAEMVKELELYFDLNIEVYNRKILTYHCTGKFQVKDGIEHILKVLQVTNKFSYSINEKRNTITIK